MADVSVEDSRGNVLVIYHEEVKRSEIIEIDMVKELEEFLEVRRFNSLAHIICTNSGCK